MSIFHLIPQSFQGLNAKHGNRLQFSFIVDVNVSKSACRSRNCQLVDMDPF